MLSNIFTQLPTFELYFLADVGGTSGVRFTPPPILKRATRNRSKKNVFFIFYDLHFVPKIEILALCLPPAMMLNINSRNTRLIISFGGKKG